MAEQVKRENTPLGQAWHQHTVGRDDVALKEFSEMAARSPDDVDVVYGLGLAQKGAGQKEEAIATFRRVLELLSQTKPENEDEANRLEMLSRMANQQIEILQRQ